MSESSGIGFGHRLTHSIASAREVTLHIQNPAISSFVSTKGPSVTMRLLPENRTRAPWELGRSPSIASRIPACASSSLYFPMAASGPGRGGFSASYARVASTITMTFMT